MKNGALLTVSAVLNLALAALAAGLWLSRPEEVGPQIVTENVTNTTVKVVTKFGRDTNSIQIGPNIWRAVESADYPTYIANLRTIGCPEETIRDIIITDINKLYAQKARALNPQLSDHRYWKPDAPYDDPRNRAFQRQLRELEREKRDLVQALLQTDYTTEMAKQNANPTYLDRQLSYLPDAKRAQLQSLLEKYSGLEMDIYDRAVGELTPEQQAALDELRAKRRTEMATLLTPTEMAEYEMRTSQTAQELRYRMGAFNASEDEYRRIYNIQKSFEDRLRQGEADGTVTAAERNTAQAAMELEMKNLLGPERFAEYQRTQDASYRELYQAGQRSNLPKATIQTVYDMKRTAEEQRRLLLADELLTPEQKAAAFEALQAETERSVMEVMGEQAYQDYQRRGGNWLQNLGQP